MITGTVSNRRALVPVTFRLPGMPDIVLEFVVDTGFAGFLTLPLAAVVAMGLPYEHHTPAGLADDSQVQIPVYGATIVWEGTERTVRVLAMGKRPLLGTALLDDRELCALFREGGPVTIGDSTIA
jgi:clan AA aspartic protease